MDDAGIEKIASSLLLRLRYTVAFITNILFLLKTKKTNTSLCAFLFSYNLINNFICFYLSISESNMLNINNGKDIYNTSNITSSCIMFGIDEIFGSYILAFLLFSEEFRKK